MATTNPVHCWTDTPDDGKGGLEEVSSDVYKACFGDGDKRGSLSKSAVAQINRWRSKGHGGVTTIVVMRSWTSTNLAMSAGEGEEGGE